LATYRSNHGVAVLHNLGFRPTGILDVGAYRGEWTQLVRHYYPEARFLMIEAQPKLESALKAVAAADPNRIEYRMALLGPEHRDAVDFFQMDIPITTGSSLYAEQTSFARSVAQLPMVRLDDVVGGGKFQLLKIDVQGAELDVLQGAPTMLANVEALFLELSLVEYNKGAPLIADMIAVLKARDFLLSDLYPVLRNRTGSLLQVDAVFLRRGSPFWAKPPFF
jgi:FkbM family methyltransferase